MDIPDFESDPVFGGSWEPVESTDPSVPPEGFTVANAQNDNEFDPQVFEDVQGLVFLGALSHSFDLFGHTFRIKTLRSGERLICSALIKDWEDTLGLELAFKLAYVAASIEEVDGRPFVASLGSGQAHRRAQIERAFALISDPDTGWFDAVVDSVYDEYSNLLLRQGAAFVELEGKSLASRLQR